MPPVTPSSIEKGGISHPQKIRIFVTTLQGGPKSVPSDACLTISSWQPSGNSFHLPVTLVQKTNLYIKSWPPTIWRPHDGKVSICLQKRPSPSVNSEWIPHPKALVMLGSQVIFSPSIPASLASSLAIGLSKVLRSLTAELEKQTWLSLTDGLGWHLSGQWWMYSMDVLPTKNWEGDWSLTSFFFGKKHDTRAGNRESEGVLLESGPATWQATPSLVASDFDGSAPDSCSWPGASRGFVFPTLQRLKVNPPSTKIFQVHVLAPKFSLE